MTVPAGLASHSLAMDDSPHARGAIAVCRFMAERREAEALPDLTKPGGFNEIPSRAAAVPDQLIDRHAALAICGGYRLKDARTGTLP